MKDPLLTNKIAFAVLAALLLVFGLPQLTAAIFGGGHSSGHGDALHLAYCCVDLEVAAHSDADEPAPADLGTLMAGASVAGGERRAALCRSCHTFEEGGAHGAGPNLWNIVNRNVAAISGFNYTGALDAAGGIWSYDRLDAYLKDSQGYMPGTAMAQRFAKDDQRADILAYLGSLSLSPARYPAPATLPTTNEAEDHTEIIDGAAAMIDGAASDGGEAESQLIDDAGEAIEGAAEKAEEALHPEE